VSAIFNDFVGRRKGIVKALTTDSNKLYEACRPDLENQTLYAFPEGTWAVDFPPEEVPPEAPEPALGINFPRDGMPRLEWLCLIAVHSDAWLISLAFFKGVRLSKEERQDLFNRMNTLPTCYEVVVGAARSGGEGGQGADDGAGGSEDEWKAGEGDPCPSCGKLYLPDEFWIECDQCDVWYCGACAKMTPAKAERISKWRCLSCAGPKQYFAQQS